MKKITDKERIKDIQKAVLEVDKINSKIRKANLRIFGNYEKIIRLERISGLLKFFMGIAVGFLIVMMGIDLLLFLFSFGIGFLLAWISHILIKRKRK